MKAVKLRADAPTWMIRMYVADDPPVNAPGRLGKRRRRVDIEFERSERGVAFHFRNYSGRFPTGKFPRGGRGDDVRGG
jgi:hypothetical protein